MNRQIFGRISGVIVDTCKPHGVWFDAGELSAIIDFVERGGLAEARTRQSQDEEREKRERARLAAIPWEAPQQGSSLTSSSGSFFISAIEALLS
jgi:Zn-finger nucleic acid-binding protein